MIYQHQVPGIKLFTQRTDHDPDHLDPDLPLQDVVQAGSVH